MKWKHSGKVQMLYRCCRCWQHVSHWGSMKEWHGSYGHPITLASSDSNPQCRRQASFTATAVTILGRTRSTVCTADPYWARWLGNVSAMASQRSWLTSTKNHLLPESHQGHRQLWTALLLAVNQMPEVQWQQHLVSSTRKMCFYGTVLLALLKAA